jgi:phthiocerol/phenolphthiocerol synthesis type-I polyketide synthase C
LNDNKQPHTHTKRVAIVGLSFRFPSTSTKDYWDNLLQGKDLVTQVAQDRWELDAFTHPDKQHPGTAYTFAAGSIGDIAGFDADFFGISPREAAQIDPQQRLLMEMSWEALEQAGIKPSSLRGSDTGVFIGIASADYSYRMNDDLCAIDSGVATGNTASISANRLSYFFDFTGPSMAIDTACSSSLVAFHQGCKAILTGESQVVLVGGISLHLHPYPFIIFSKASMLSKQGHCNVFDNEGDGYVRSEGGGIFVLKDYDTAVADGDHILAIVAHSAINTDGKKKGITVPSANAQAALLTSAYKAAGIDVADIDYVEAHGTGTAVGDPIEARALSEALGKGRPRNAPLLIGSVKSNMGHLETASGVAGMVKAIYSLNHRVVPATIGIKTLNKKIHFSEWNLHPVTQNTALTPHGKLTIGVNSFGFGGANAHVILQSHEHSANPIQPASALLPFVISGATPSALRANAQALANFITNTKDVSLYDVSYCLSYHRDWLKERAIVYAQNSQTLAKQLLAFAGDENPDDVTSGSALATAKGPVFVYSGNGSQWHAMGKDLFADAVFNQTIQEIDRLFSDYIDYSLADDLSGRLSADRYEFTELAQPALFALQVGITTMLRAKGIIPKAVIGHSVGEVAAAWAAGIYDLADAIKIIYQRSHFQGTTKGSGQMTAIGMGAEQTLALLEELNLNDFISLAGTNSAKGVTVAGSSLHLELVEAKLLELGVFFKRLDLDYAFHSPAMDPIKSALCESLADITPQKGEIPFYSTVTGERLSGCSLDANYWWENIRQPVEFSSAMQQLVAEFNLFVEIGPHPVLRSYCNDALQTQPAGGLSIATLKRNQSSAELISKAANLAILAGIEFDLRSYHPVKGNHINLPVYTWQKERHWLAATSESLRQLNKATQHPLLGHVKAHSDLTWVQTLDTKTHPLFADHVVGDVKVFPGTAYIELALAAAHLWRQEDLIELEDIDIQAPLVFDDGRTKILESAICANSGQVTIRARELLSHEPANQHSHASIMREPARSPLKQKRAAIPERQPDFTLAQHLALTEQVGLRYGPLFQTISHGWVDENRVLGIYALPDAITQELDAYCLHPAILDCAFQLIIQLMHQAQAETSGMTYIPVSVGRVTFQANQGAPHYAEAQLLRHSPHSILANFSIFDAQGELIAFIKEARFRSVRLNKAHDQRVQSLQYHYHAEPLESSAIAASQNVIALAEIHNTGIYDPEIKLFSQEIDLLLDELARRYLINALHNVSQNTGLKINETIAHLRAHSPFKAYYLESLVALTKITDNDIKIINDDLTAFDLWRSLLAEYPDFFNALHPLGRAGIHLGDVLQGNSRYGGQYTYSHLVQKLTIQPVRRKVCDILNDLVCQAINNTPSNNKLSVLEISQFTPVYTLELYPLLVRNAVDIGFISLNPESGFETKELQEHYPAIACDTLIAGETSKLTTLADIVLVVLDFQKLSDAQQAIAQGFKQLKTGGTLLVLNHEFSSWIEFTCGLEDDWWHLRNDATKLSNPTLESRQQPKSYWQHQLSELGCGTSSVIELSPPDTWGYYLLCAQRDTAHSDLSTDVFANKSVLILSDAEGASFDLATHALNAITEAKGKALLTTESKALLTPENEYQAIATTLRDAQLALGTIDTIIYLVGWKQQNLSTADQILRCDKVATLIKASEELNLSAQCLLISSDVFAEPAQPWQIHDCALWGFVRTMMNEYPASRIKLVDIDSTNSLRNAAASLAAEALTPNAEDEVIFTADNLRLVPRLSLIDKVEQCPNTSHNSFYRLVFDQPGQLRNLYWQAYQPSPLAADELSIKVHATGLNFRDVMYTLGFLMDEAIENGFAGPTLGLEFSGIVTHVGADIKDYAIGDKVVGFGPASFGNQVNTKTSAIAKIPENTSFEAAATIPSTFFTAYYAIHYLARIEPGESILIHGAAGGVGIAAIQIAKWCGANVFVTAGAQEKHDFLKQLGVEHVLDSRSLSFADDLLQLTNGKGVDVVLNSLSGEAVNRNLSILKPFGRFLELGKRDFYENSKIGLRPFRNNISYFGIDADQLMSERPELTQKLFAEVMTLFHNRELFALPYQAFEANDVVDAFRYMQQAKQIGKIVITYRQPVLPRAIEAPRPSLSLSADASYLVTGGVSGFGFKTAQWLAEKGAKHLVLISRGGQLAADEQLALAQMTQDGITTWVRACDVTDKASMTALFADMANKLPPLKGIVHAAAVIEDSLICNQGAAQIERVFTPKIEGALNLHELSLGLPLDFFVLYSSATTLFGNPGQSSYVAANMWLEGLARYRRKAGLPATAVLWGAIDDAGFLARNEQIKEALESRMGGAALASKVALAELEQIILKNVSEEGFLTLNWQAMARFLPNAKAKKFSLLIKQLAESDNEEASQLDIHSLMAERSPEELEALFIDMIKQEVSEILRVAIDKIDHNGSIYDMGMDSLMGVELVLALETRFGVRLSVMALAENATIGKLANKLITVLTDEASQPAEAQDSTLTHMNHLANIHAFDGSLQENELLTSDTDHSQQSRMIKR